MELSFKPSASLENIRLRAQVLKLIRDFFAARNVMEVETPLIGHTSVTDPYIQSIPVIVQNPEGREEQYYLQTSPEYTMKRLLASGSGAIYQITKAFRQGEHGRLHQPEFSMIEWYRPGFDHHTLMDEVAALLQLVLKTPPAEKKTYAELFQTYCSLDPHQASVEELINCATHHQIDIAGTILDKDTWLQLLMTHLIEPQLGKERPCFIYDFPASMAALAKIIPGSPSLASRFEVYFRGIELANGFHELQDPHEQRTRFLKNLAERKALNFPLLSIDELFLSSLSYLPDCSGVALGIDRLLMLVTNSPDISHVISFDFTRI